MQMPQMPAPPAPPTTPTCSNCVTTTQLARAGAIPNQIPSSILRSSDGKMRLDFPNTSVITNPASGYAIFLNHLKQEAHVVPIPKPPQMPQMPHIPGMGTMPSAPPAVSPAHVEELGMGMVEGVEVMGKRYTVKPPALPKMPAVPQPPSVPQAPGAPKLPSIPQEPALKVPAPPHIVTEIWTSTKLKMPVLTTVTGAFGQHTCYCKHEASGEHPPTAFQIPPNYTQVQAPEMPKPPAMPKMP